METKTYNANGIGFNSFLQAIKAAQAANTDVIETATGISRWSPIVKDEAKHAKKMRLYKSRLNAYRCQQGLPQE